MKICIERHDDAIAAGSLGNYRLIRRCAKADFTDMPDIETSFAERGRSTTRQSLTQQKPRQAASRLTTSSST